MFNPDLIPFNRPYLTGKELHNIQDAVNSGKISGDGKYTKLCHEFFQKRYSYKKCLLTTSCTDALEMASLLLDVNKDDEVIVPSYTFVSTANPFIMRGAKIVFCDSHKDHPNINENEIEALITEKTKAIILIHYAGVSCNMDAITQLANKHDIKVIEDAAQAIEAEYNGKPLGGIGLFGAISFHETKNVNCGEGGLLIINDESYFSRAEIIREKGTNRSAFFRGEIAKYNWVDIGSSFLPSDLNAAYLCAQLENIEPIQQARLKIWRLYYEGLENLQDEGRIKLPVIPEYATNNAHMFYLVCNGIEERDGLIDFLKSRNIWAVFHYQSLHRSPYFSKYHDRRELINSDNFSDCLLRLPMFVSLEESLVHYIVGQIQHYFNDQKRLVI